MSSPDSATALLMASSFDFIKLFWDVSATVFPFFMFLSPAVTVFRPAVKAKTGHGNPADAKIDMPPLPIATQFMQCVCWLFFGFGLGWRTGAVVILPLWF